MILLLLADTDYKAELERIKRRIERITEEINFLKQREEETVKRVGLLENMIDLLENYLYKLRLQENNLKLRLKSTEVRLRELEEEKGIILKKLKKGINLLYLLPKPTLWEFIFNPEKAYAYYERAVITESLIYAYRNSAREIEGFEREYTLLRERRKALLEDIRKNISEQEQALSELKSSKEELSREIESIRKSKAQKEAYLSELREKEKRLEKIIKELAKKKEKKKEDIYGGKTLTWPLRGRIVGEFGYYTDPRYGVRIKRNGIRISAPTGSDVYASADGKVVYSGYLEGYGNVVIIESGGLYLIYGNLMDILVGVDKIVKAGMKIGTVGSKPLYFEVREGTKPVDPLKYLP
ncbi:MAG: peptidoglycan DD-metalloendopeptidase family protein [candidate division WOR-3 bacterium]